MKVERYERNMRTALGVNSEPMGIKDNKDKADSCKILIQT